MQAVCPGKLKWVLVVQLTGAELVEAHWDPAGHSVHDVAPLSEYVPAVHVMMPEPSELGHAEPAAQVVQVVDPALEYSPGLQGVCVLLVFEGHLYPGRHTVQEGEAAKLNSPSLQSVHVVAPAEE